MNAVFLILVVIFVIGYSIWLLQFNPTFHNNLAMSFYQKKLYDQAVREYQRAIQLNPELVVIRNNLSMVYLEQGNYAGAIQESKRALELNPDNATSYNNIGMAYFREGDFPAAEKYWQEGSWIDREVESG